MHLTFDQPFEPSMESRRAPDETAPPIRGYIASDRVQIRTVSVSPTTVSPGGTVTVGWEVRSTAEPIADPDACVGANLDPSSANVEIEVLADGSSVGTQTVCIPTNKTRSGEEEFGAPSSGSVTVRIVARGAVSGTVFAEETRTVTVDSGGGGGDDGIDTRPGTGDGGGGGGGGNNLLDSLLPTVGGSSGVAAGLVILVVVLFLLLAIGISV